MARVTTTADELEPRTDAATDARPLPREVAVMGRDTDGRPLPPLRERLSPAMPADRVLGWLVPLFIAAFAGVVRFWNLGYPAKFVFDETYYPKDAWSLLQFGVERQYVEKANDMILEGNLNEDQLFQGTSFVVHPPAGKWVIALGEWLFGMTPFGWRFAVAALGTLSVLLLARIVRRMTRSTLMGSIAGLLLALDGLHFVESRIALIDLPLMFWVIASFGCLLLDRDWMRRRLAVAAEPLGRFSTPGGWGPALLWRPWRLAAGVCFGLACATKWNALFVVAAFGLLTWFWDLGARRAVGAVLTVENALRSIRDAVLAFVTIVVTAVVVYLASWTGWFVTSDGWDRTWASNGGGYAGVLGLLPAPLQSLLHYHAEIWNFHTTLHESHPYASNPSGWLVIARPVAFYWVENLGSAQGCKAETNCVQEILGIGTPALWWAGVVALLACLVIWIAQRDWRFGVPVVGVAATWLPWFMYADRPIFYFYAVVILPFMVMAVTLVLGKVLGPSDASPNRRMWGAAIVGGYLLLVLLNFAYLYPILSSEVIPKEAWLDRMWFRSWS